MKLVSRIIFVLIFTTITSQNAIAFSLKKVKSAFGGKPFLEIIEQEYTLDGQKILVIENERGNITIKTDWECNKIALKATVHKTAENENHTNIISDTSNPQEFVLRTLADNNKYHPHVDYELIVPSKMKLKLINGKGDIWVNDTHGITLASTDSGNIFLNNVQNKARAATLNAGSIHCKECTGALYVSTTRGNIRISDAQSTVVAKTDVGKIHVKCSELKEKSQLDLSSTWGNIAIALPEDCDADIKAHTERGTCICEHYITLRPQTTKLNDNAWSNFKRSIDGTIGSGRIPVQISSVSSNIRIAASRVS